MTPCRVDSLRWIASRLFPKRYGDKPQDEAPGELKISWQMVERVIVRPRHLPACLHGWPED
jgi:hypothetical protein